MDLQKLQIDRSPRKPKRRGSPWIWRVVVLVLLGCVAWLFRGPILKQVDRWRLPSVEVAVVVRSSPMARAAVSGTAANGYVVARRRAALSADTPGRIVELNVEEGTVVRAGDVVARLYADEFEAALRRAEAELAAGGTAVGSAEAREAAAQRRLDAAGPRVEAADAAREEAVAGLELAELEHDRSESLLTKGTDTRERYERAVAERAQARARVENAAAALSAAKLDLRTAQAELDVARSQRAEAEAAIPALAAARDAAQATLDKTFVRAPFDGIIVLKDAEVGEVVSPNAQGGQSRGSVATMVDFDSLEIQVELPETSLSSAELGANAEVFLDAFPDESFPGTVERIWPTANRQKATVEIRVGLAEIDPRMRPDMGARVVFSPTRAPAGEDEPAPADALLVPVEALVRVDGRFGVFVLERGIARFREVAVGSKDGRRAVVERGLEEGERVVLAPSSRLADGDRVQTTGGG